MNLILVIMAAGMGHRYGGDKQMDPVGPSGEFLLDYSVYDAMAAGFKKIVFVIRRDIDDAFRSAVGKRAEKWIETAYAYQDMPDVEGRTKPWGTGEAILSCEDEIDGPFAVINADDFYGTESFDVMAHFLTRTAEAEARYGMVGFLLNHTLSHHGSVARGVCRVDRLGHLKGIEECVNIHKDGDVIAGKDPNNDIRTFSGDEPVSMNMWGFKPGVFDHLNKAFEVFLHEQGDSASAEFLIPPVMDKLIAGGSASVDILETGSTWFGVTHPEDRQDVEKRILHLIKGGVYPDDLGLQYPMFADEEEND